MAYSVAPPSTDELRELGYRQVHLHEHGGSIRDGSDGLGLRIFVRMGRELTTEDERTILRASDLLMDGLDRESVRMDSRVAAIAANQRTELVSLFPQPIFVETIPNGYCSQACCSGYPWYIVTTTRGRVKIGWRKHVIEIDWTDSTVRQSAEELFPQEDVTRIGCMIHAWGLGNAREYVRRVLGAE